MFVKENLDRKKKKFQTLMTKPMQMRATFMSTLDTPSGGGKVREGDACILWMGAPHYVSNDSNSSNLSSF